MWAAIEAIEYYLPERIVTNDELATLSPDWTAEKIRTNSGIEARRIAAPDECASDLAVAAGRKLFASGACAPQDIDYLLVCTQSADYFLPSTACLVQQRLGLSNSVGALDINLGCSGFVYGLGLAKGLIETGQARRVLLITSETMSRYLGETDLSVRILFGDAAAATLVCGLVPDSNDVPPIGSFTYGTDGGGSEHMIVRDGAMRGMSNGYPNGGSMENNNSQGGMSTAHMNGPEIFAFTLREVPKLVDSVLADSNMARDEIRWYVFHQANQFILEHLRKKLRVPQERFCISMSHCGNTTSSTIPIALKDTIERGQLSKGDRVLLAGFGVGLSWAGTMLRWAA